MITAAIVAMAFAFSLGNVTRLCLDLGITAWIAWLVGPAVDLSVIGLLVGMRFLSLHGYTDAQLAGLQRMLRFCGLLTLALNTAGSLSHRQYGTALVDAVGPALLVGWSEAGRARLLRQIHSVCPPSRVTEPAAPRRPEPVPAPVPPALPARLLARARELDAVHRAETGRPISRDTLRAQLRIGRDRASALVATVRAEAAAEPDHTARAGRSRKAGMTAFWSVRSPVMRTQGAVVRSRPVRAMRANMWLALEMPGCRPRSHRLRAGVYKARRQGPPAPPSARSPALPGPLRALVPRLSADYLMIISR